MFETFIVQPIFNFLVLIYALIPGHDFGLAVIVFTVAIRFMLWPLLRKQLHQSRLMRQLQPEIKKIRAKAKDKQQEGQLMMELYKERGVNPFGSIGVLFLQFPILIGLFQGLRRLAESKDTILTLSYDWVQQIGWMRDVVADISKFDETLFGAVDLTRSAFSESLYFPALALALLAAGMQYFQSKQLMPDQADSRSLRQILKDEAAGKKAEQSEINAAMGRNMRYFFPVLTFVFASTVPAALGLYWATGSLVGYLQQRTVLGDDVEEMEEIADTTNDKPAKSKQKKPKKQQGKSKSKSKKKR
jgi:YidC/Oxa1 family membrane protein insertase